ncbi:hypothetical protein [Bradyrhizobium sp. Leo170]|uniref:hypothetical protein n=1 Tax=Bradyrhizobium sp. Leo170 TaxID=1571199 RepID=UPI00102E2673|nr:hypothetical protein [Bradyrhizobium sp. Leo170]TAI67674.1 hypothetical protein CWO89_01365 [Bradyrhizobium sp. Leo170]
MAWKDFGSSLAITRRRRVVATALVYGLSLTVRFTSAAGEETEASAQAAQSTSPMISGAQIFYKDWPPKPALPIAFQLGWPLGSRSCRAACESAMPMSSLLNCPAP